VEKNQTIIGSNPAKVKVFQFNTAMKTRKKSYAQVRNALGRLLSRETLHLIEGNFVSTVITFHSATL
jgi:hypothetical protein